MCGSIVSICKNFQFQLTSGEISTCCLGAFCVVLIIFPRCGLSGVLWAPLRISDSLLIVVAVENKAAFELCLVNSSPQLQPGNHLCGSKRIRRNVFLHFWSPNSWNSVSPLLWCSHTASPPGSLVAQTMEGVCLLGISIVEAYFSHYLIYPKHLQGANVKAFKDWVLVSSCLCYISRKSSLIHSVGSLGIV